MFGSEGSGIIQEVGEGVDPSVKGLKVAFLSGGWARYTVKDYKHVVPLDNDIDLATCANAFVNPMTNLALLDHVLKK